MNWVFHFDIENKRIKIEELEKEIAKDGFWDDLENSQNVLKKSKGLKSSVEKYEALKTEIFSGTCHP